MNATLKFEECFLDYLSANLEIDTQNNKNITGYGKNPS